MIVIDSSAAVAIFRQEPEAGAFAKSIGEDDAPLISAATVLEISIVLRALKRAPADQTERWLDDFIQVGGIRIEAVTPDQINLARAAHACFGKGSGHPAGLNFGDCFAYALAFAMAAPLLFKGDDFRQTDIAVARA